MTIKDFIHRISFFYPGFNYFSFQGKIILFGNPVFNSQSKKKDVETDERRHCFFSKWPFMKSYEFFFQFYLAKLLYFQKTNMAKNKRTFLAFF